jgi:hypothetical protein
MQRRLCPLCSLFPRTALALGIAVLAGRAEAAVLHVDPSGFFSTVQAAIDSAATGDTLLVASGIYEATPIVVDKDLLIRGTAGGTVFFQSPIDPERGSAGIVMRGVRSTLVIEDVVLRDAKPPTAAGIMLFSGHLLLRRCRIERCELGVVAATDRSRLELEDCTLVGNGIAIQGGQWTRVVRTRIEGNGLGVTTTFGEVQLTDVEVIGNGIAVAAERTGAFDLSGSHGILERVTVRGNVSRGVEAGIWMSGGPFTVTDCVVEGNVSTAGTSGIAFDAVNAATLIRCTIRDNRSRGRFLSAAGLTLFRASVEVIDCTIQDNDGEESGGGVCVLQGSGLRMQRSQILGNASLRQGGGVFISESFVELTDVVIAGNAAATGGAVFTANQGRVVIVQSTLAANRANAGAAFFLTGGTSTILRSIIAFHTGSLALFCAGAPTTYDCVDVYGNSSDALCGTDAGGNVSVDPLFCDLDPSAGRYDVRLNTNSPVGSGACGRLGAGEATCTSTTATRISWSALKQQYAGGGAR